MFDFLFTSFIFLGASVGTVLGVLLALGLHHFIPDMSVQVGACVVGGWFLLGLFVGCRLESEK